MTAEKLPPTPIPTPENFAEKGILFSPLKLKGLRKRYEQLKKDLPKQKQQISLSESQIKALNLLCHAKHPISSDEMANILGIPRRTTFVTTISDLRKIGLIITNTAERSKFARYEMSDKEKEKGRLLLQEIKRIESFPAMSNVAASLGTSIDKVNQRICRLIFEGKIPSDKVYKIGNEKYFSPDIAEDVIKHLQNISNNRKKPKEIKPEKPKTFSNPNTEHFLILKQEPSEIIHGDEREKEIKMNEERKIKEAEEKFIEDFTVLVASRIGKFQGLLAIDLLSSRLRTIIRYNFPEGTDVRLTLENRSDEEIYNFLIPAVIGCMNTIWEKEPGLCSAKELRVKRKLDMVFEKGFSFESVKETIKNHFSPQKERDKKNSNL